MSFSLGVYLYKLHNPPFLFVSIANILNDVIAENGKDSKSKFIVNNRFDNFYFLWLEIV